MTTTSHCSSLLSDSLGGGFKLNDRRIGTIMEAASGNEAAKMGLIDTIIDKFFRNGAKRERIIALYEQLAVPDLCPSNERTPIIMAYKFNKLREMADEEHRHHFQIRINQNMGQQETWSYSLHAEEYTIFQSEPLDYRYENYYNEVCTLKICNDFDDDLYEFREVLSQSALTESRIQTMSDDESVREEIREKLDDPRYAKEQFSHLSGAEGNSTFFAHFTSGKLELSNRGNETGEFRGNLLKNKIEGKDSKYQNLRELCSCGFMTKDDSRLVYVSAPHRTHLNNYIDEDNSILVNIQRILQNKRVGNSALVNIRHILQNKKVGETNLYDLFELNLPEGPINIDMACLIEGAM
ncbi:hypothetical protein [Candidatus Fukatsuia endosymbiont of Tuberolachnus salignus]|uniref:hypothetical protein n=1 Tax=Candidatus Fukatsuia endosymbiont of Tuberolachnus salignus TaxID=3077957 RepID=UPI00313EDBA6